MPIFPPAGSYFYGAVYHIRVVVLHEPVVVRPDITGSELWEIGYNIAEKAGYAEHINIWFGHGIGIEVIEPPFLDKGDMRTLKQGTFVNIEPGIFLPGIGGAAIEDTTFITKRGVEFVTKCNRELHVAR